MNTFPPVEDAVLQANPRFAALYKTLTTRILQPDGSSNHPAQAERDATAEALKDHRIRVTKSDLLRMALRSLPLAASPKQEPLLAELVELIILLSLKLSTPSSQSSLALLHSTDFYASIPSQLLRIGELLSAHLHAQAMSIARLLNPTTNASFLHRTVPKIPAGISSLLAAIDAKKAALASSRLALVPLTRRLLTRYRTTSEMAICILEQTKHGLLARSVKAKSELLKVQAQLDELNAKTIYVTAQNAVYLPDAVKALRNYAEHLRDARNRLRQRERDAEIELSKYGIGRESKEKVMREIARVYGEMTKEIEEVKRDLVRLKGK